jgi:hypothetical protein
MTTDTIHIYAMRLHLKPLAFLKLCGVGRTTWWRWKTHRYQPRAATAARIEETYRKLAKRHRQP